MKEKVLVIPAEELDRLKGLPGVSTSEADIRCLHHDCTQNSLFVDRDQAEVTESLKQVIPYIVIRHKGKILAYMRSKKAGEGRLHNKWSIGVGGHINPQDDIQACGFTGVLSMAISRELLEELDWGDLFDCTVNNINKFGIIYDPDDAVGRVHIGYVLIVDIPEKSTDLPRPKEDTIAVSGWYTPQDAIRLANLEGWSRLILEAMLGGSTRSTGNPPLQDKNKGGNGPAKQ